jgi:hypothetical protein
MADLPEWVHDMCRVVDDKLMRDIAQDFRRGVPQPKSILEETKAKAEPEDKSGWTEATPLKQPLGISTIDRLCEAADRNDRLLWKLRGGPV